MKVIWQAMKMIRTLSRGSSQRAVDRRQLSIHAFVMLGLCLSWPVLPTYAQTSSTGALAGTVSDPSKAVVPNAKITAINVGSGDSRTVVTNSSGEYLIPLLPPGMYRVEASKEGFKTLVQTAVTIAVAETSTLNVLLQVGEPAETVTVTAQAELLQTQESALGRVTSGSTVRDLPLVSRNFTQVIGLSPGVSADVNNAGDLGRGHGGTGESGSISAHGANQFDNNFQLNGVEVNDINGSGTLSGGVPIPNPDTIQEFKVQTGQYDASYGRNAGANVDLVTKGGSNEFHGGAFEFFRNTVLNANDFFRNVTNQPRQVLNQNQFGTTLGGPISKDKLLFFVAYQGTRQRNGVSAGCSDSVTLPPLTNDRSAAALGGAFGGQTGALGGSAVAADGSNINPAALALLNLKLPDGSFVIPTPQTITGGVGLSSFSIPCNFNEDQFNTNADWLQGPKSKLAARFFFANSTFTQTLPPANLGGPISTPGFSQNADPTNFRDFSLTHTYVFSGNLTNQATLGFHRLLTNFVQTEAFKFSDIGVSVPSFDDAIPQIVVNGQFSLGGNGQTFILAQNAYNFGDSVSYIHGKHFFRFGGGIERGQHNLSRFHFLGGLIFLSFPDFLLGESAAQNGSPFSNVFASVDLPGLLDRAWRIWDGNSYAQDTFRVTSRFTLNYGLRYERIGTLGDSLGRSSLFDINLANPDPPASGTLAGYVVGNNFPFMVPSGVKKADSSAAINGDGQNTWGPRIGFAWRLPHTERLVLRGGYGIYYSRYTAEDILSAGVTSPPFGQIRQFLATNNAAATFENPFPEPVPAFPAFLPYDPTTALNFFTLSAKFRPPILQQYSVNLQTTLSQNLVLQIGYEGSRGTHGLDQRFPNQALSASASNPVHGETTNTLANVNQRADILGIAPMGIGQFETEAASWYNALTVGLTKRINKGLQFQISYTWNRALLTDPIAGGTSSSLGSPILGDQLSRRGNYGLDNNIRPQRLVASYVYELPGLKNRYSWAGRFIGGWQVSGVTVFQSGQPLTVIGTNAFNIFGINGANADLGELSGRCTVHQFETPGSVTSKLNNYLNSSCFSTDYPVVPGSGGATGFGNAPIGAVRGPDQRNWDIALIKRTALFSNREIPQLEFRTEFFNAFNTPQFANPNTALGTPGFGQITKTAVNPRILQFGLKLNF